MISTTVSLILDIKRIHGNITNVVLVHDHVSDHYDFVKYANSSTFPIIYNNRSSKSELLELLTKHFSRIERIAFVSHFSENPMFLDNSPMFESVPFLNSLAQTFTISHFDFLACSTLLNPSWTAFYSQLSNVIVGASDDFTGNRSSDWIMENTGENIQPVYFTDMILTYPFSLDGMVNIGSFYFMLTSSDNSATVIYNYSYNTSLLVAVIPASISFMGITYNVTGIGAYAFEYSSRMTSVTIPNSIVTISQRAFYSCPRLTSVTIPNSVTTIEASAFYDCIRLSSVIIGDSVTTIGSYAFDSTALISVTIPGSVTSIGDCAFGNTTLTSISVHLTNAHFSSENGILFNADKTRLIQCPRAKLGDYTIPDGVTTIGVRAFNWSYLSSITIPSSVVTFEDCAFLMCNQLTNIIIPSSVTIIGTSMFQSCSNLTSVTMPNSINTIGDYAFAGCSALASVIIPSNVETIGRAAFRNSGLTSVIIPRSVITIGREAFAGCSQMTTIDVNVLNPNYYSENGVLFTFDKTTLIQYPANKPGAYTIPNSVTVIGLYSFLGSSLASVKIPNSVVTIEESAFQECYTLTSVIIPNSVRTIGRNTFTNSKLMYIKITSSIIDIGQYALFGLSSLISVTFSNYNKDTVNAGALLDDSNKIVLFSNLVDESEINSSFLSHLQGYDTYIQFGDGPSITIPGDTTTIDAYAYQGCSWITSVTIPNNVTLIDDNAFQGCTGLTSIAIPDTVTTIGKYAFANSGLIEVTIPGNVITIGNCAFQECSNLNSIVFLKNTKSISIGSVFITNACTVTFHNTSNESEINDGLLLNLNNYSATILYRVIVSNACLIAGTPIVTDQGIIDIDKLIPSVHTIRGMQIRDVLRTRLNQDFLIEFPPNSLYDNVPSQHIYMTANHCVYFKGCMVPASFFTNVRRISYKGEILYNVLLDTHDKMVVSNMIVETLSPDKYKSIMR